MCGHVSGLLATRALVGAGLVLLAPLAVLGDALLLARRLELLAARVGARARVDVLDRLGLAARAGVLALADHHLLLRLLVGTDLLLVQLCNLLGLLALRHVRLLGERRRLLAHLCERALRPPPLPRLCLGHLLDGAGVDRLEVLARKDDGGPHGLGGLVETLHHLGRVARKLERAVDSLKSVVAGDGLGISREADSDPVHQVLAQLGLLRVESGD
mmetsp:Transcript_1158/g.4086  ORF Transcript_1158/g.4086 Transcript_1158/m.4086 type:complete len:215 (-) Transcript_1158:715-1359(-)